MMGDPSTAMIRSVQVGPVAPLGPKGVSSGFRKSPVAGRVAVGRLGLEGDAQADLTVHGGTDKAVYVYPNDHYAWWRDALPEHAALLRAGGFGENLTVSGLDEDTTCIGDVFDIGSARLQVTQFRQPCFKLALYFGDRRLPQAMVRSGRAGWYLRVVREGSIGQGDAVLLMARPNPTWSVRRLAQGLLHRAATPDELAELADMEGLAEGWRHAASEALTGRGQPTSHRPQSHSA
jgi:MOSC domain-containing protein YiiM